MLIKWVLKLRWSYCHYWQIEIAERSEVAALEQRRYVDLINDIMEDARAHTSEEFQNTLILHSYLSARYSLVELQTFFLIFGPKDLLALPIQIL